ncbi:transposase domain-containing protein [Tautonia marina]|uniref:transposase domain-containing protein n=1 Tax=Tautonia marina TaxID=2653855 RepID=UPI0012612118|nr:transposase domain-containing protein [Tautonia marina]
MPTQAIRPSAFAPAAPGCPGPWPRRWHRRPSGRGRRDSNAKRRPSRGCAPPPRARRAAGGRTAAILLSVTQRARAFGLEPWSYLRDLLGRVSTHPASWIAELLPDQWQPGCERS